MGPLLAVLLAAAALAAPIPDRSGRSNPIRVAELVRAVAAPGTADADRRAAEEQLKGHDPVPVLPLIVAELEQAGTGTPVAGYAEDRDAPAGGGAGRALSRLWEHYMFSEVEVVSEPFQERNGITRKVPMLKDHRTPAKKEAIGVALAALLKDARAEGTRRLVLRGLRRNYAPAAEAPLAAILGKKSDPDQVTAAEILLERHPKKYASVVIDRVADPDRSAASRHLYLSAFLGGPVRAIGDADRRRLVRVGFALLAASREYFTASYLGSILNREFTPDSGLAKYRGPTGLTEAFFADTVTAALAWWAAHGKEFE